MLNTIFDIVYSSTDISIITVRMLTLFMGRPPSYKHFCFVQKRGPTPDLKGQVYEMVTQKSHLTFDGIYR